LIKGKKLFTDVQAYIGGDFDPGLFSMSGFLNPTTSMEEANNALLEEIDEIKSNGVSEGELQMAKNKVITTHSFAQTSVLNKAMGLGIAAVIDNANLVNEEVDLYNAVKIEDIQRIAKEFLNESNSSTLYYKAKK